MSRGLCGAPPGLMEITPLIGSAGLVDLPSLHRVDAESLGNAIPLPNNLQSQVRSLKLQAGIRNDYGNKEQAGGYQWR